MATKEIASTVYWHQGGLAWVQSEAGRVCLVCSGCMVAEPHDDLDAGRSGLLKHVDTAAQCLDEAWVRRAMADILIGLEPGGADAAVRLMADLQHLTDVLLRVDLVLPAGLRAQLDQLVAFLRDQTAER
jgi:hypothetical protein